MALEWTQVIMLLVSSGTLGTIGGGLLSYAVVRRKSLVQERRIALSEKRHETDAQAELVGHYQTALDQAAARLAAETGRADANYTRALEAEARERTLLAENEKLARDIAQLRDLHQKNSRAIEKVVGRIGDLERENTALREQLARYAGTAS